MADLNSARQNTSGVLSAGYLAGARVLDFILDLSADVTMGTATDNINLATLSGGTLVLAVTVEQLEAGTGTGTLVARVGTTTISGTLASTATAGTLATVTSSAVPLVVAAAGAELNLLGATAVRTDGKVRVIAVVVEGDRTPSEPAVAARDQG